MAQTRKSTADSASASENANQGQSTNSNLVVLRRAAVRELGHREETVGEGAGAHLLAVLPDKTYDKLKSDHNNPTGIVVQHVNNEGAYYNRLVVSETEFAGIQEGEKQRAFNVSVAQKVVDGGETIQLQGSQDGNDYIIVGDNVRDPLTLKLYWVDKDGSLEEGYVEDVIKDPQEATQ